MSQYVTMISFCVAKGSSFLLTFPDTVIKLRSLTLKRWSGFDSEHLTTHAGKSSPSRAAFIFPWVLFWVWLALWTLFSIFVFYITPFKEDEYVLFFRREKKEKDSVMLYPSERASLFHCTIVWLVMSQSM